jgi:hypothetical protein
MKALFGGGELGDVVFGVSTADMLLHGAISFFLKKEPWSIILMAEDCLHVRQVNGVRMRSNARDAKKERWGRNQIGGWEMGMVVSAGTQEWKRTQQRAVEGPGTYTDASLATARAILIL